jgi:DEAD/DEAH box helicase domain-containing protein
VRPNFRRMKRAGNVFYRARGRLLNSTVSRYHTHPKLLPFPSRHVHIRGASEETYAVVDTSKAGRPGEVLEEVEFSRALFEIYEGAVVRSSLSQFFL